MEFEADAEDDEKEAAILAVAAGLQSFYETHHNLEDNIDCDDSDDSDEPVPEPRPKRAKSEETNIG